eukprot:TRINITY_DN18984_c0_g1_i1.p2 TRINITY_DN18984_c0_g1~~TRINITY_DN18984_c0_g1_i1.p2  ORF type:complete len:132 (-),score=33.83 TRINITY_DN18984_c0_g1_i1:34-429(-)
MCSHRQLEHTAWFSEFIPQTVRSQQLRCPDSQQFVHMLKWAGFSKVKRYVSLDEHWFSNKVLMDPDLIFKPSFRRTLSIFSDMPEEELQQLLSTTRAKSEDGSLQAHLDGWRKRWNELGHTTFTVAEKLPP